MTAAPPSGEELRTAAAHGLRWSAISRPAIELMQFLSIVVLARLIAPAEFGRYAIALIFAEVAKLPVAGGLGTALVQRKTLDPEHEETGFAMALGGGLALTGLTILASRLIVAPIFGPSTGVFVRIMAPLCLIEALATVPVAKLRRQMAFRRLSELELLNSGVRVIVCVALALVGLGGEALVLGVIAGATVAAVLACLSAPLPRPGMQLTAARELLGYAVPVALSTISWVGFGNVDYAVIGARLGVLRTGYYFRAYTFAVEYQSKIGMLMNQVGFPVLARTGSRGELDQLYRQMIRMLTIVLFPALVLLAIAAPVAVPFLFGPRWSPAIVPAQILALGGASAIIFEAVGTVFMTTGRVRTLLGFGWAQFIVYGLAVYAAAPQGITAVAIAGAVVHALFAVLAYVLMLNDSTERSLRRLWSDIAPATVSCAGLAVVAVPVSHALSVARLPAVLWLSVLVLVGLVPYLVTLRVCFPATWRAQCSILERILPGNQRLNGVRRRLAAAAAVH